MEQNLVINTTDLREIRCSRCQSSKVAKGSIKKSLEDGALYFEQKFKCKDCEHETVIKVKI